MRFSGLFAPGRGPIREFFSSPTPLAEIPGGFEWFLQNHPETIDPGNRRSVLLFLILHRDSIVAVDCNNRWWWELARRIIDAGNALELKSRAFSEVSAPMPKSTWPRLSREIAIMSICSSSCIGTGLWPPAATIPMAGAMVDPCGVPLPLWLAGRAHGGHMVHCVHCV
jgi:hypothetical protein